MEKKTFNLTFEVLKRFAKAGILKNMILIGSWSVYFYKYYFNTSSYGSAIRTRDIDFLVPIPYKFAKKIDVFKLVEDLGFIEDFKGSKGYIKLEHPDLTIEFLVPERGRGQNKPYSIHELGVNAVSLRYLDFLVSNTIVVDCEGMHIRLPHPSAYALHKFIIFKRRRKKDKHDRDIEGALRVFMELMHNNQEKIIKRTFNKINHKWQRTILKNLESIDEFEAINILKQE